MRELFLRVWRYLNYPADTNGKVKEVWERMRVLSYDLPRRVEAYWRLVSAVEKFGVKTAAVESDLRFLKTIVVGLQNQLNSIQDHLRSSQPWLPSDEGSSQHPEVWLLAHLVSFFRDPIIAAFGAAEAPVLNELLDAGFAVHVVAPDSVTAANLSQQFKEKPGLHVCGTAAQPDGSWLRSLLTGKETSSPVSVLKIGRQELDSEMLRDIEQLHPELVMLFWSDPAPPARERNVEEPFVRSAIIREMRAKGYRWNLQLFHFDGVPAIRWAANLNEFAKSSSGNYCFFRSYELFKEAYSWSRVALPWADSRSNIRLGSG